VELTQGLQKANEEKDEFLAVVSHELRTPITTIYGGARLLKLRRAKLSDEAIDEMITSVAEESERLYRLVEDLLAIARTEMSRKVELESVSLADVVEQTVIDFERWSSRPTEISVAADVPDALAEPSYLHHVIYNLLTNANKYSPPDQAIEIDIRTEASNVAVRVSDRGTGVPDGELPLIFDRFYRSSDAVASQVSGKGLGLTVCKRLIEALSGEIWAVNREGGGLEVGFTLPTGAAPETQAVSAEQA
jgi:K+-sensing histidine kinase KdpD